MADDKSMGSDDDTNSPETPISELNIPVEIRNKIDVLIEKSLRNQEPFPHMLLIGGDVQSAHDVGAYLAQRMRAKIHEVDSAITKRCGDLAGILTNMEKGDILFVKGMHSFPKSFLYYLTQAAVDFSIDIMIDKGPHARQVKMQLPRFTLVATIPQGELRDENLKNIFFCTYEITSCASDDLKRIFLNELKTNKIECDSKVLGTIIEKAKQERGVQLFRRLIQYAKLSHVENIDSSILKEFFETTEHILSSIPTDSPNRFISDVVKREVWQRDLGKCVQCGSKEKLEFDHIIPISKGGSSTARNIQLLCEGCNRSKSDSI